MQKCITCPGFNKTSQCYSKYSGKPDKSTATLREVMHVAGDLLEVLQNSLKQCKYFRKPKSMGKMKKRKKIWKKAGYFVLFWWFFTEFLKPSEFRQVCEILRDQGVLLT